MILKPYVDREERDPRRSAGRRAERQMAHYLDRHFREHTKLHVLHDVRIEHDGEVAQMDHVVVHGFGIAIVESKSVSTSVRINAAGEWERRWGGRWSGMPDAILQGERQGLVLKRLLTSRQDALLDKVLGLFKGTFGAMALDVFAAISDDGTIERAKRGQAPRVMKA
ncbi:MAG: NERD domain-containing protein, partial [Trueperaceae bacterium]